MARLKKEKTPKYYEAAEVETEVKKILDAYPEKFNSFGINDIKVLFKTGKMKEGKKHVSIKIVKEPITLISSKKAILFVVDGWWQDVIDSDRTKGLIEGLLSIEVDDFGELSKRPFDVQTFAEIAKTWAGFKKILPGEKEDLVLSAE